MVRYDRLRGCDLPRSLTRSHVTVPHTSSSPPRQNLPILKFTSSQTPGSSTPISPRVTNMAQAQGAQPGQSTGFFVEKDIASAKDFYERKVKDLGDSLKDLEGVVQGKAQNVRVVEEVIRLKVMNAQEGKGEDQGS
ncbi:hypothetical protein IG631_16190 [Alternaria alternata]|nr:hypothetical protein IG631_16190 [Alternaria alternata]